MTNTLTARRLAPGPRPPRPGSLAIRALLAVGAVTAALIPSAAVAAGGPPTSQVRLALPAPTGDLPVGVRSTYLADPSRIDATTGRPRALPIRVWYPARTRSTGPAAPYLSSRVRPVIEQALGVPAGTFNVDTHAHEGVPMGRSIRGVILVSPGKGNPVAFETGQVIDLASRGWVLVTIDHPHDAFVVGQPDGTLVNRSLDGMDEFAFDQRVIDVGLVLAHLSQLVPAWRWGMPVGIFGHSMGGATAAEALLRYGVLRAGVDLDGTPRGGVLSAGLDEPFGTMLSDLRTVEHIDDGIFDWFALLRGPHPVRQLDVYHNGFTDFVVFAPEAALVDPAMAATFEGVFRTDATSVAHGRASLAAQRTFLAGFMHRYLRQADVPSVPAGAGAVPFSRDLSAI